MGPLAIPSKAVEPRVCDRIRAVGLVKEALTKLHAVVTIEPPVSAVVVRGLLIVLLGHALQLWCGHDLARRSHHDAAAEELQLRRDALVRGVYVALVRPPGSNDMYSG